MSKGSFPAPRANLAGALTGLWKLKSRIDLDAEGKMHVDPFLGADPIGMLCFQSGHFAAQFMKRDRSNAETVAPRAQAKNNTAGVNGYDGYFGSYTVDETAGTITTTIEGSISPANIGQAYTRDVRVSDGELVIRLETTAIDGTPVIRTNTFSRIH